jgi:transcriptional regulator with XRE-family HTH domain
MAEKTYLQMQIERRRKAMGLSQRALSKKVGPNDSLIKSIESGKSANPRSDTLAGIASALGCSVADLTGETAAAPPARKQSGERPTDREIWYHVIVKTEQWFLEDGLEADPKDKAEWLLKFHEIATLMNKPLEFNPRAYSNVIQLSRNL